MITSLHLVQIHITTVSNCISFPSLCLTHFHSMHIPKCNIKCSTCFRTIQVMYSTHILWLACFLTPFCQHIFKLKLHLNACDRTWIFHYLSLLLSHISVTCLTPQAIVLATPPFAIPGRHLNVSEYLAVGISPVLQAHFCSIQLKTRYEILLYKFIYILSWPKSIYDCLRMKFEWGKK